MKVIQAESAGFCWGVRRAINKALELARTSGSAVHTDGPLIHNPQMISKLAGSGIAACDDPQHLQSGTLLIRAHGIPPERRRALNALAIPIKDATCPDVARIQSEIKRRAARGVMVVIYGDPGHPEVTGLLGYAGERGRVISSSRDVDKLPACTQVAMVAQSTQFHSAYAEIAAALRKRFPEAEVLDTICQATRRRQQDLAELAKQVDVMIVVGGTHSANTQRLAELARSMCPTFHIETAAELDPAKLSGFQTAGLTGGASTPDFILAEVKTSLEAL